MSFEVCPACGGNVAIGPVHLEIRAGDRLVPIDVQAPRCEECGESYFTGEEMDAIQRRAADVARREDGLLTPSEIQALRAEYGLSQDAFERLIHAGPKTVTRWERGAVCQNGTADTLMRVLRDHPGVAAWLASERGVALAPAAKSNGRRGRKKAA